MSSLRLASGMALVASLSAGIPAARADVNFETVSGPTRATSSANDRDAAWRDVGVRVDTSHLEFEARMPICQATHQAPPGRIVDTGVSCSAQGDGLASFASTARRASIVWKAARDDDRLPDVDLMLRHWNSRVTMPGSGDHGSTAGIVVGRTIAGIDATLAYETPLSGTRSQRWRIASASLASRPIGGLRLEMSADVGRNAESGEIDRSWTLRVVHRFGGRGPRLSAWARRSLDGREGPVRAGVTVRFVY